MESVAEWLASLGLGEYAHRFADNGIDMAVVADLTEDDLRELGVLLGHRRKLLRAIHELGRAPSATAEPDAPVTASALPRDEAERRQLSVMFCDLVGSSALSLRLDPEDMREVMHTYHRCLARVIGEHQGMVARYMGDGVLAYFGYPHAHEDDSVLAARAGLAIVDAVGELKPRPGIPRLQVRVGISTGTVVVGDLLGEGAAREQAVVGETPNLAARLQTVAEPGAVVVCDTARQLAGGHFDYRDLGPIPLKGWSEPVHAWQVVAARDVESRFEATHAAALAPLIGREEEVELLLRRWRQARHGEGRVVLITGEPGIGKSRVALALEEAIRSEPHVRLRYFCSPHHANSALHPFIAQLERAAGFQRHDTAAQRLEKLETLVAPSRPFCEHVVPLLASLLSLPASDRYPLPAMPPQKRKQMTLEALLAQLERLAGRQPVLMSFEDAHWADPTSLELLGMTVERLVKLPVLLVVTARPELTTPWPAHAHLTTLPLMRLSRRENLALIERVAGGKPLPEEVLNEILVRTDGVPLFVEELTKTVVETGVVREQDGAYVLDRPLPALAIPTTLHASLMARLDRLAPVREVAQIGAVVGREFFYELLGALAGLPKERLDEALQELVRAELVFRRGEIPEAVFTFKHALVRDAAYSGLLKSRRQQLHEAIANLFEQRFPDMVAAQPETLAHHLAEAGLHERAAAYWLQGGRDAAARSANLEAIAHLQRGVEGVQALPASPARDRIELDLQFALAPCLIATQGAASARSLAAFTRARELCERLGEPAEYQQVMFWLATASVVRGELPQALEADLVVLRRAEARGDRPALLNAIRGQAMILLFLGRVAEARAVVEHAVEVFDASDESARTAARAAGQDCRVASLALMSWASWLLGDVDSAVRQSRGALQRAEAIDHAHTRAYAAYYAAVLHALRGEPAIADRHAQRCLALSEEHGFRHWRGLARSLRGICATALDSASGSLEEVRAAVDEYHGAGYQLGITALYVLLAPALLARGERDQAREVVERGLAIVQVNSEALFAAELRRLQTQVELAEPGEGACAAAEAGLERALAIAREQRTRSLELRAAIDLATLWTEQGRRDEAVELLRPLVESFDEGQETPDHERAHALLGG
jgi:class 3 adenylate cyclase/tetratricopeptide (TPR) repeat protein